MRWETCMSCTVNDSDSTPHPMGSIAASQTPRATSCMVTSPAVPSMESKALESTPS